VCHAVTLPPEVSPVPQKQATRTRSGAGSSLPPEAVRANFVTMQIFLLVFMIALALTLWGRSRFLKIYRQESGNLISSGLTGARLAEGMMRYRGIKGVTVKRGRGVFDDFYYPETREITLAPQHFSGSTFSALAIAAQQAGKALQHAEGHRPLLWRTSVIRWTVYLSLPLFVLGALALALGSTRTFFPIVLLIWSAIAFWNVLTVPTELDAGSRARRELEGMRVFRNLDERVGVHRVMGAASAAYLDGVSVVLSWAVRTVFPARKN
jgi:uncharacterized protein